MDEDFVAPGPGEWVLDRSHYPGGTTPISAWLMEGSMGAGMERVMGEIGAPVRRIDGRFVRGFMYTRVRPLIGADKPARRLPPALVLKAVTRLHPEFRRRAKRAAVTLRDRPYLDVVRDWETRIRPELQATNAALQQIAPHTLDDEALQGHVNALLAHLCECFELHFWLHGHDLGPIARYLYATRGWGIDAQRAVRALSGASPSTAAPGERLHRLRTLVDAHPGEANSLADVRLVSDEAAALLDEHLARHGAALATGYDLTALTLDELPNVVLGSIRSASPPPQVDVESIAAALRADVPPASHLEFDERLHDARAVMDMRDDNGPLTVEWPAGLLRRALLAAGTRLVQRGRLLDAEHALELTPDEVRRMFDGGLPTAAVIEARSQQRRSDSALTPPATLGTPEPQPSPDVLPNPLPTLVAMIELSLEHMGMNVHTVVVRMSGVGIGAETYVGRARTARSADDAIELLEPGDVLIVRATSPAFNAVLPIAGAIVTADGGAMSHAAVLARELGIPAVVGAAGALEIPDGSQVEVDPVAGRVRIIE